MVNRQTRISFSMAYRKWIVLHVSGKLKTPKGGNRFAPLWFGLGTESSCLTPSMYCMPPLCNRTPSKLVQVTVVSILPSM